MKLNISCGTDVKEGFVNTDLHDRNWKEWCKDNEYFPANMKGTSFVALRLPGTFPWKDNSVDFVYISHVLEDFCNEDFFAIIKEIHRVMKPGALLEIRVPEWGFNGALANPHHQKMFQKNSFQWLAKDKYNVSDYADGEYCFFSEMISCKSVVRQSWLSHIVGEVWKMFMSKEKLLSVREDIKGKKGIVNQIYELLNHVPPRFDAEIQAVFRK